MIRDCDTHKAFVYVGALTIVVVNVGAIGWYSIGQNPAMILNHILFALFGVFLLWSERAKENIERGSMDFRELEKQVDDDLLPAVRFTFLNAGAFGNIGDKESVKEWAEVAAELFDADEARIARTVEELKADIEYHARTGELPDP